ncbi:MAG TPA: NADH-quinone oxidoreductase subunit N [Acidimicrobiales bacterium]|nr:NADH-quinone oxidoreductase subunit N [Acidimicrobiales bacterium]
MSTLLAAATTAAHGAHQAASGAGISLPPIRYLAILPEIVMLGGAVLILAVASLVRRPLRVRVATVGSVAVSGTALGFALWQWADVQDHGAYTAIDHAVAVDGFSVLVAILVPCAMLLSALVADGYLRREGIEGPEYQVLALVSASGAMVMAEANDLILVFLGLEILSLALYVLAAFNHRRRESGEAALKYFILGGFSSAVFLYGIALTYGATGSTNLTQIADFLSHNVLRTDGLLLAGLSLLLVGFAFKIAAVPFHMWTPDVYQGSPSPVTGFMAAVAKVGGFAALLRVFVSTFGTLQDDWRPVLYVLAIVTLLVGAGLAVVQRDVKRMLAYSSINHAGFVLLGLQAATAQGVSASLYYLFAYAFMVIGTFAIVTVLGRQGDGAHDIASYRGLAKRQPLLALALAVLLLAQAGAPFTTGLWAKLQVVVASVDASSVPLAVIAMVSAAVAGFFYLRVAVLMYSPLPGRGSVPGLEPVPVGVPVPVGAPVGPVPAGEVGPAHTAPPGPNAMAETHPQPVDEQQAPAHRPAVPVWAGTEQTAAAITRINAGLLLDDDPVTAAVAASVQPVATAETPAVVAAAAAPDAAESVVDAAAGADADAVEESVPAASVVPVPALTALAIALCVGVTVVFGIIPAPLVDLAHKATLLFVP